MTFIMLVLMLMMLTWNNNCEGGVRMGRGRGRQHC